MKHLKLFEMNQKNLNVYWKIPIDQYFFVRLIKINVPEKNTKEFI